MKRCGQWSRDVYTKNGVSLFGAETSFVDERGSCVL